MIENENYISRLNGNICDLMQSIYDFRKIVYLIITRIIYTYTKIIFAKIILWRCWCDTCCWRCCCWCCWFVAPLTHTCVRCSAGFIRQYPACVWHYSSPLPNCHCHSCQVYDSHTQLSPLECSPPLLLESSSTVNTMHGASEADDITEGDIADSLRFLPWFGLAKSSGKAWNIFDCCMIALSFFSQNRKNRTLNL